MLIEFKFKNFRSFQNEQTLSMAAGSIKELPHNVTKSDASGRITCLNSVVVFGANASGKSNIVKALSFFRNFVKNSFKKELDEPINVQTFLFDPIFRNEPSEFEVSFIHEGVRYQYGFSLNREQVLKEWLIAYPKGSAQNWFNREFDEEGKNYNWFFSRNLISSKSLQATFKELTRKDILFLSLATQFNNAKLTKVYNWVSNYLKIENSTDYLMGKYQFVAEKAAKDSTFKDLLVRILAAADLGITDLSIEEKNYGEDVIDYFPEKLRSELTFQKFIKEPFYELKLGHHTNNKANLTDFLNFEDESFGTQRLLANFYPIYHTLTRGQVLIIDEMDSSLHPLLVRFIISLFHEPEINNKGAQLIINTHDTTLLDSTLFRRDQIWFVEKDSGGVSHLYSLLEYSPRKVEALQKNYLQGRYGAIPFIGDLDFNETAKINAETEDLVANG